MRKTLLTFLGLALMTFGLSGILNLIGDNIVLQMLLFGVVFAIIGLLMLWVSYRYQHPTATKIKEHEEAQKYLVDGHKALYMGTTTEGKHSFMIIDNVEVGPSEWDQRVKKIEQVNL